MKLIALVLFPLLVNINAKLHNSEESLNDGNKLREMLKKLPGRITQDYVPPVATEIDWNDSDIDTTDEDLGDTVVRMVMDGTERAASSRRMETLIARIKPILKKLAVLVKGTSWEELGNALLTILRALEQTMKLSA